MGATMRYVDTEGHPITEVQMMVRSKIVECGDKGEGLEAATREKCMAAKGSKESRKPVSELLKTPPPAACTFHKFGVVAEHMVNATTRVEVLGRH
jgi:hypothetical protein